MKQFIVLLLSAMMGVIMMSCKESGTNPPEEKPPGYQEDIPWPSLADSPWPAGNANMQRTGRSKFVGPIQGVVVTKVPAIEMQSGISIGTDSVFYFSTSDRGWGTGTKLVAAKLNGQILWSLELQSFENTTTPFVDVNGVIYLSNGGGGKIYAVNIDGTVKWIFNCDAQVYNRGIGIGKDGTLYVIDNLSNLYAIKQNGVLLWKINNSIFGAGRRVNLCFSPDGGTLYIHGNKIGIKKTTLVAFDLNSQQVLWEFGNELLINGPMIDSQGNIYLIIEDDSLNLNYANFYCLSSSGVINWKFSHTRGPLYWDIDPTIDKNGNIFFATDSLYSLDHNGNLRWKRKVGSASTESNYTALVCDANGTIYLASMIDYYNTCKLSAISNAGSLLWEINLSDERAPGISPAITSNNQLILSSFRSKNLWIIK